MPTTLATRIVPLSTAADRRAAPTHPALERSQDRGASWAFTWSLLTGWELPDVPDWPSSPAKSGETEGAPVCRV